MSLGAAASAAGLREVLRPPLIAAFVGVVASGLLLVDFLLNAVLRGLRR